MDPLSIISLLIFMECFIGDLEIEMYLHTPPFSSSTGTPESCRLFYMTVIRKLCSNLITELQKDGCCMNYEVARNAWIGEDNRQDFKAQVIRAINTHDEHSLSLFEKNIILACSRLKRSTSFDRFEKSNDV